VAGDGSESTVLGPPVQARCAIPSLGQNQNKADGPSAFASCAECPRDRKALASPPFAPHARSDITTPAPERE
jgi:hypothetical protein